MTSGECNRCFTSCDFSGGLRHCVPHAGTMNQKLGSTEAVWTSPPLFSLTHTAQFWCSVTWTTEAVLVSIHLETHRTLDHKRMPSPPLCVLQRKVHWKRMHRDLAERFFNSLPSSTGKPNLKSDINWFGLCRTPRWTCPSLCTNECFFQHAALVWILCRLERRFRRCGLNLDPNNACSHRSKHASGVCSNNVDEASHLNADSMPRHNACMLVWYACIGILSTARLIQGLINITVFASLSFVQWLLSLYGISDEGLFVNPEEICS